MPKNNLDAAIEIAQEAGKILIEELSCPLDIAYKGDEVDLVTQADIDGILSFHEEGGFVATSCLKPYQIEVPFGVATTRAGTILSANLPAAPGLVPQGPWMLYVVNHAGVPSVARWVQVN